MATLTAAQEILLAALALNREGRREFSEWDLTVSVWNRDRNRFGCRGYEDRYPDHKRVMMEVMGKTKKDNPVVRGWFEKVRANYYRMTSLGVAEAERLTHLSLGDAATPRSVEPLYDSVRRYVEHAVFQAHLRSPEEPRTWLGAASFLGLARHTPDALEKQMRMVREAADRSLEWLNQSGQQVLTRGPVGGGAQISRADLEKLRAFVGTLEKRFEVQFKSIRAKTE